MEDPIETPAQQRSAYFCHYFREWGAKISGVKTYRKIGTGKSDEELRSLAVEILGEKVRSFRERIGEDYPEDLDMTLEEYAAEIEVLDELAEKYNSTLRNFVDAPNLDGIEAMGNLAQKIRDEALEKRGLI
ncbi:hypothetical protein HOA55_00295 [archaeon]|jgi:hypothetical protein|nr:hypothetical protein [archaeon]MBT3577857.1 hypothetical protein [archaeon]MBT6819779.1 hypothetical protein [archaeon]MBT6955804.1 hypothetical protein [archaeon]MBT7025561.1 hypothetical protein [archaeon]